jgi:hypothetical protein
VSDATARGNFRVDMCACARARACGGGGESALESMLLNNLWIWCSVAV